MRKLTSDLMQLIRLYVIQRRMSKSLPVIFNIIDREMRPSAGPCEVTRVIKDAIEYSTGKEATVEKVLAVISLYSPIESACKRLEG